MEFINKLEKIVLGWAKDVPHLPAAGQRWLGANVWWIAAIGAVISAIASIYTLSAIFRLAGSLNSPSNAYYVTSDYTSVAIMGAVVSLVFLVVNTVLLGMSVKPLQTLQKKGWVLLFLALLLDALSVIVHAVLTFSVAEFIVSILLGAIGLAIGTYFVFEIHGQFAHRVRDNAKKPE